MKRNYHGLAALGFSACVLGGCNTAPGDPSAAQQTGLVTCQAVALALPSLATARANGLFSAAEVASLNNDFTLVDPICLGNSNSVLAGTAAAAASEIITLSTKGK